MSQNNEPEEDDGPDEFAHQCAAYFAIAICREHEGLFCDIVEIELPPFVSVKLELPLQSQYSIEDVEETAEGIQNVLFFSQNYLIRYTVVRANQEE